MTRQEAISKLRKWDFLDSEEKEVIETLIPELKESEDLNIKRNIQYAVRCAYGDNSNNTNSIFAWLEKRGEKTEPIEGFNTEFERQISHLIASAINKEHEYNEGFVKWTANALLNYAKQELEKQCEQKTLVKIELKFKAGDWIINSAGTLRHILAVGRTGYETNKGWLTYDIYENGFHLWTINDAKDGDVLTTKNFIFIFKNIDNDNGVRYYCHYEISNNEEDNLFEVAFPQCVMGRVGNGLSYYSPATEEQCNLLFSKMKEAGYEWDSEKKELKKIEQNPAEDNCKISDCAEKVDMTEYNNGYECGKQRVLKYPEDYGLCKKPAWSEEDEGTLNSILNDLSQNVIPDEEDIQWLKSLKERVQPKQEWSEEDEEMFDAIIADIQFTQKAHTHEVNQVVYEREIDWFKSIKERMEGE